MNDIKQLKRASRILVSLWEVGKILLQLNDGQSLIIDSESGEIFKGKVRKDKLTSLGVRIPGKLDQGFDLNFNVPSGEFLVENSSKINRKKHIRSVKKSSWEDSSRLFNDDESNIAYFFIETWKRYEKEFPEKIILNRTRSPMGHNYLEIHFKDLNFYGKLSEKTMKLMYIVENDIEIAV